jgi:hypothetical protein
MGSCRSLKDDDVLNFKLLEHAPSLITLRKYSTDLAELYKKKLKYCRGTSRNFSQCFDAFVVQATKLQLLGRGFL